MIRQSETSRRPDPAGPLAPPDRTVRRPAPDREVQRPNVAGPGRRQERKQLPESVANSAALFERAEELLREPCLRQRQEILASCRFAMQAAPPEPAPPRRPGPIGGLLRRLARALNPVRRHSRG